AGRGGGRRWLCLAGGLRLRLPGAIGDLHDRGVHLRPELCGLVGGELARVDRGLDAGVGLRLEVGDETVAALARTLVGDLAEALAGLELRFHRLSGKTDVVDALLEHVADELTEPRAV